MGRFLRKLRNFGRKINRFVNRASGTIGKVAGALSNVPVIGNFASGVARAANLVNKVSGRIDNIGQRIDAAKERYKPTIDKIRDAGRAVHNSGVLDKITNGRYSRVYDKVRQHRDRIEQRGNQALDRAEQQTQRLGRFSEKFRNALNTAKPLSGIHRPPPGWKPTNSREQLMQGMQRNQQNPYVKPMLQPVNY